MKFGHSPSLMRTGPFLSLAEVGEYLSGERIECLECGCEYRQLTGKHLRLKHLMTPDEYRDKWGVPRMSALAGTGTRSLRRSIIRKSIANGKLTHKHLPRATEAARKSPRKKIAPAVRAAHAERISQARPGDWSLLPAGATLANGRNAGRTREYQRALRAQKRGDAEPMRQYAEKWRK